MGQSTYSLGAKERGGTFLVSAQSASISGSTVLAQVEQLPIIRFQPNSNPVGLQRFWLAMI